MSVTLRTAKGVLAPVHKVRYKMRKIHFKSGKTRELGLTCKYNKCTDINRLELLTYLCLIMYKLCFRLKLTRVNLTWFRTSHFVSWILYVV